MKLLLSFFSLIFVFPLFGQNHSNDWIDYSLPYYKFSIVENGIYRISHADLVNANIPISTLDPRNLMLFGRGEEIPLFIKGETDGIFNSTDYIEFYAQANDGWLDSVLYKGKDNQPNPYYSLINDTAYYFLTYDSQTNHKRFKEENNINFSSYFSTNYVLRDVTEYYTSSYHDGEILSSQGTDVEYVSTEGYMDNAINLGGSKSKSISTPLYHTSGPAVEYEYVITGQSNYGGINNGDHHLKIEFLGNVVDTIFEGFRMLKFKGQVSPSAILNSNSFKMTSINDLGVPSDRTALSYIKIVYPHSLDLNNASYFEFLLDNNSAQNAFTFNPTFFNSGNEPLLYDITNAKKIKLSNTFTGYKAVIPNGNGRKKCVLLSTAEVKSIGTLKAINGTGFFTDYTSLMKDSAYLMITHPKLFQSVNNYAVYRENMLYNTVVVNVEELYDQFSFGIKKHPLSIRNFSKWCLEEWTTAPQYIYLMGKSVKAKEHRKNPSRFEENLVPSMGNPAADNLFTSGLNGAGFETAIPTGRIAANSNTQIEDYLDKVVEYENAPRDLWMKRALHFAGGSNSSEVNRFENYLQNYEAVFEDTLIGGFVNTFRKTQNVPIQTTLSDSIRTLVNNGVALMTFFGHASSTGGFDISIDDPENFNNKGKYPVLLANSCFSGDIHQTGSFSTSEDFVLQPNKGTIGFIASVNLSQATFLNYYSSAFYEHNARQGYGKSLAYNMQQTVKDIQNLSSNLALKSVCLEMSLHGDPALSLYSFEKPDYIIKSSSVRFDPQDISTEIDSFVVHVDLINEGRAVSDSLLVELIRNFPGNSFQDTSYFKIIPSLMYANSISFKLPVDILRGVGTNTFMVNIDPINQIDELSELNNSVEVDLLIRSGSIVPIYPYNFALVPNQNITLKASTAYAFEENRTYIFELDTNDSFSSPFKVSNTISSTGGVVEWSPSELQNMPDSAVYFWRVSKTPSAGETHLWRESSFQYIQSNSGWSQDHFSQYKDNDFLFLNANNTTQKHEFVDNVKELKVQTIGNPSIAELNNIKYQLDADVRERSGCSSNPAFFIAVLDSLSLESWETPYFGQNPNHQFGQANFDSYCGSNRMRPEKYFVFRTNSSSQMLAMENFLNNEIPNGNFVVIYNWFNINYSNLRTNYPNLLPSIVNLGADSMLTIKDSVPFVVIAKKGTPSFAITEIGDSIDAEVSVSTTLTTSASFGNMESVLIGPSKNWNTVKWNYYSLEPNSADSVSIDVFGVKQNGEETNISHIPSSQKELDLTNLISAHNYPFLKLRFNASDDVLQTSPQLKRWQVNHDQLPDAALNPKRHFSINEDTLQEGEKLEVSIAIDNISDQDMDSLLINYTVIDQNQNSHAIPYKRLAPLLADSSFISSIEIPTFGLMGKNTLLIDVNPNNDQAEQFHFNNIAQLNFFVKSDRTNPLLDVTFDGRHILNGEIVSAKPEILIQLTDNNNFLAIDDTSSIEVYLTPPGRNERKLDATNTSPHSLIFYPAKLPDNKAKLVYRPELLEDGKYKLRVRAKDKTGNESGSNDYSIEFEVVTKSTITHMVNYPNPFTTSTRFVFTLTGSKVPDDIQIQILTITGKVVKEIYMEELGPIRIGNNITDYAWDGTDEFGDRLANGIYLYRFRTRINGQSMEHRESASDKFFKEGFGKMYLMR